MVQVFDARQEVVVLAGHGFIDPALKQKHRAPSISQVSWRNGWESRTVFKGRINIRAAKRPED
jgi:hypothetical protein